MKEDQEVYQGEMLIQTATTQDGLEKLVYTKDSFVKDKLIRLDTKEAQLVLKYNLKKIEQFQKSGLISTSEAESLKEDITSLEKQMESFGEWKKNNPKASPKEQVEVFKKTTNLQETPEEARIKSHEFNRAIRKLIAQKELTKKTPLFKSVNPNSEFGITKTLMDSIYHLPALLKNARAYKLLGSNDLWEIKSSLKKSKKPIGLSHVFRASTEEDARKYLEEYKAWISGEGLKVFTAYWKAGGEKGRFNYSALLTEVMAHNAESSRKSSFSVKERQKFWANTRKLENTKLTVEVNIKKGSQKQTKGKQTPAKKLIIEHRLVDVGARIESDKEDSYPNNLIVRVLNPEEFEKASQLATAIHNNTLKLPPKDILLALTLQTRQAQTREKEKNTFDEDYLIEAANLQKTAKSNKSKARSDLKKKLKRFQEKQIIGGHSNIENKGKDHTIKKRSN